MIKTLYPINEYEVNKFNWLSSASLRKPSQTKKKMSPRDTEEYSDSYDFLVQVASLQKYFVQQVKTYENMTIEGNYCSKSVNSGVSPRAELVKKSDSPEYNANNATKCLSPKTATGDTPQSVTLQSTSRERETTEDDPGIIPDERLISADNRFSGATSGRCMTGSKADEDINTKDNIDEQNQISVECEQTTTTGDDIDISYEQLQDCVDQFLDLLFCSSHDFDLVLEYSTYYSDAKTCEVTVVLEKRDEKQEREIKDLFNHECTPSKSFKLHIRAGRKTPIQKLSPKRIGQGNHEQEPSNQKKTAPLRPGDKLYVNTDNDGLKPVLLTGFYSSVCKRCSHCESLSVNCSCKKAHRKQTYMLTCAHAFESKPSLLYDSERREVAWPLAVCHKTYQAKNKSCVADLALLQVWGEPLSDKDNRIELGEGISYKFVWANPQHLIGKAVSIIDRNKKRKTGRIVGDHGTRASGTLLKLRDSKDKAIAEDFDSGAVVLIDEPGDPVDYMYLAVGMVHSNSSEGTLATSCQKTDRIKLSDGTEVLMSQTVQQYEKVMICTKRRGKINGTVIYEQYTSDKGETVFRIGNDELEEVAMADDEDIGSWVISRERVHGETYYTGFGTISGPVRTNTLAVDLTRVLPYFNCEVCGESKK